MKLKSITVLSVLFTVVMVSAVAQKANLDMKYKVGTDDAANYLNWKADGVTIKDGFDTTTGASKANSTKKLDVIRFDESGKKNATPSGLRAFLLFPVASSGVAKGDNLNVTSEGGKVTIKFIHRGTAYQITSDEKGNINMESSFQKSAPIADNIGGKFVLKDEFVIAGGDKNDMASADWSKITLLSDVADPQAGYEYIGKLKSGYSGGILTMKGTLQKKLSK